VYPVSRGDAPSFESSSGTPMADSAEPHPPEPASLLVRAMTAAAYGLYDAAGAASVPLRLIGSLAVSASCPRHRYLLTALGRRAVHDIDFVAYRRDERTVARLFEDRGYLLDPVIRHSREFGINRLVYHDPTGRYTADVFLDELVMAHTVDLRGRLELAALTVTPVDLLLSKLQIHAITDNDLIDLTVLLAEHDTGPAEAIDLAHLTAIMARDWGFHHTAMTNLRALRTALERFPALPPATAAAVDRRIATIQHAIEQVHKTRRWRLRARIGTRMRWYEHVDDINRQTVSTPTRRGPTQT
jgi:hypothetical protein